MTRGEVIRRAIRYYLEYNKPIVTRRLRVYSLGLRWRAH